MYGLFVILPVLFGFIGYREASKFARENGGKPPWGLPPAVWAVFAAFSLLIGGILLAIARRTTAPPTAWGPTGPMNFAPPEAPSGQLPSGDAWAVPAAPAAPAVGEPAASWQSVPTRDILPGG